MLTYRRVFVAVTLCCLVDARIAGSRPQESDRRVPQAQIALRGFLQTAYPDLDGRALQVEFVDSGNGSRFAVRDVTGVADIVERQRLASVLTGYSEFDAAGTVRRFSASGAMLAPAENGALAAAVAAARRDGRSVDSAIQARHPRFGLDSAPEMIARVEASAVAARLGVMAVESAAPRRSTDERYGLVWDVTVTSLSATGTVIRQVLSFEPVGGQLVAMEQR